MTNAIEAYVKRQPGRADREGHTVAARAAAEAGPLEACTGKELLHVYEMQEAIMGTITNAMNSPLAKDAPEALFECQDVIAWNVQNHVALAMWKRLQAGQDDVEVSAHMCACLIDWSLKREVPILPEITTMLSALSEAEEIGEAA